MQILAAQIAKQTSMGKGGNSAGVLDPDPKGKQPSIGIGTTATLNQLSKVLNRAGASTSKPVVSTAGVPNVQGQSNLAPVRNATGTYASRVAMGEHKTPRLPDGRPRGFEAWKATRARCNEALTTAAISNAKGKGKTVVSGQPNCTPNPFATLQEDEDDNSEEDSETKEEPETKGNGGSSYNQVVDPTLNQSSNSDLIMMI
ncbi:hypothetical protein R1sor_002624 [Riccia sorocarpa]|uniref:Uncharacterized protein n=1 Tax=Riccia sorocarpa TaxID=122646 RepID=A0ABD3GZB7_9MARC